MTSPSLDLTKLLPPQYRDKTLDTLIRGLFNRHLSKTDVLPLFGHVGDSLNLQPGDIQIQESDLERQINQLSPIIYTEHGTEKLLTSWPDLLQKMALLGIDYKTLNEWFTSKSYNFVPPIDLDKFCNFNQYFWIGEWITTAPSLPYYELGIPAKSIIDPIFAASNVVYRPEYYVIERGLLDSVNVPVPPQPGMSSWSDWSMINLWVHRNDIISFLNVHGGSVSFGQLVQAARPLIEYSNRIKLNSYQTSLGVPAETGTFIRQIKQRHSQLPLFDLYDYQGTHTNQTSAIFYYKESSDYIVDPFVKRRIATDSNNDFIFEHSLVRENKELLFYKLYESDNFELKTIWRKGPDASLNYSQYDSSGTLINQDKFTNFSNYFWVGTDLKPQPSYNPIGLPEYTVVEAGGTTNWSIYNYWVHVGQLKRSDLLKYVQATRPIIEFNKGLESEIIGTKTSLYQLPIFRLYSFNDITNIYEIIPTVGNPNLNDAYVQSHLFARVADLTNTALAIVTSSEVLSTAFEYNDEYYIQDLYTGEYNPSRNGVNYGYVARHVDYDGVGNGLISAITTDAICIPQVLTLTANSLSTFSVVGTVTGAFLDLTLGFPYSAAGANFKITSGDIAFEIGDTFIIELKSFVFDHRSLFVNLGGVYRTLTSPSSILSEKQNSVIVPANPDLLNGIWEVAPQLEWNVQNETRVTIGQGDIYYHLTSIIEAQPGLIGGSTGDNNWRNLTTKDVGIGGKIKQYDGNTGLLISLLLQQGISHSSLIEFAYQGYEHLFNAIHTFVIEQIPTMLSNVEFTPPVAGDLLDPIVIERFKAYFANISSVVLSSATSVDDYISTPFYDSTSAIQNLVVTLPYMGLVAAVVPEKTIDLELNLEMLIHHDGHSSKLPIVTTETLKNVVTKSFVRSPGQQTPGLISGVNKPGLPYKGQFWFKTSDGTLWFYNVVSDVGEELSSPVEGTYSYNRLLNTLKVVSGGVWITESDVNAPWTLVKLDLIEANLLLAIEQELYINCPPLAPRLDEVEFQSNVNFDRYQQQEFEKFGVTYGVTDVYGTTYVSTNAFTWNYSSTLIPGASDFHAVWQEIYRDIYNTSRPDLQPWFSCGYSTESEFLTAYDVYVSNLPGTTTSFDPATMWPDVAGFVHSIVPGRLSVDITTGTLLPPYSLNVEGLISVPPGSAAGKFVFGDLGPIELYWRKTLNFLYSEQKSYFRLNPLKWTQETWGIKYETAGEYVLNSYLKNKESVTDFQLHGDALNESPQLSWFSVSILSNPVSDIRYDITCVSRLDNVFKIKRSDLLVPFFTSTSTSSYTDSYISLEISPTNRGFFWGDGITVTVHPDGTFDETLEFLKFLRTEGFNQIYVQYSRSYGSDLAVSINKSLFSKWTTKLGYRFGGFVNTDALVINSKGVPVVNSAFNTYLKENKYYNSSWLDALRIQLVQRGSTEVQLGYSVPKIGPNGTPGEDWIFRVDNFNPSRPKISWYQYDTSGGYQDFIALDGKRCMFSWKHYGAAINTASYDSPFLITGIQNVVDFIFGFSDLKTAEGWNFNDQENPVLDPSSGRPIGYQLLIEQFIVQQFSGAVAGSAFLFNPFSRKVWYKTPRGIVTDLFDMLGLEQETVPTLLNSNHLHIERKNVRVFRQDDITEVVFDEPAFTIHLLTSEYEHVVLFENYSADSLLLYDPFLGQKSGDIFLSGEKQTVFSGRIDFGGHFLLGDQMKRNIESSVEGILGLYNTTSTLTTPIEKEQARALLGFQKKQYFADRGTPDQTEFRFWQGMIANKGTNFSVDAYVNSQRFKNAKLDEYWAYKLSDYGDARSIIRTEMKSQSEDCTSELTNYLFLEKDELSLLNIYQIDGGYDVPDYGVTPFDSYSLYTVEQAAGMEFFDPRGTVIIQPSDEDRWFRYFDLNTLSYFTADILAEWQFVPDSIEKCYRVLNSKGVPVKADCFEIVDPNYVQNNDAYDMLPYDTVGYESVVQDRYYEMGDYIPGTDPGEYSDPKFKRINSSTIQIIDQTLLDRPFKVIAYGPAIEKYSPNVLFNYQTNTTVVDDIIWWDPARGSHHPTAYRTIDYEQPKDPACYNMGTFTYKNDRLQKQKPWGENEVGKVWWNNFQLDWQLYSDTKVYPDLHERLARWGAPADFSEIEVNEWIKSSLSPQDFEKSVEQDGELSVKHTLNRTRTWYQRVVAWKYSDNPAVIDRKFITYQPSALKLSIGSDGYGTAILRDGSLTAENIGIKCKITAATYSSTTKIDANLVNVFGQANVISNPKVIVGSSFGSDPYEGGPVFVPSTSGTMSLSINSQVLSFRSSFLGKYQLSNQLDPVSGNSYITLTHVLTNTNQQLRVHDIPIAANTQDEYNFDQLGITIKYSTIFNRTNDTEPVRIQIAASILGNPAHDIFLRSYVDIFSPISFGTTILDGNSDLSTSGWVAWIDPEINPVTLEKPPFNKYIPILGNWVNTGTFLSNLVTDIINRTTDAWIGFDGEDFSPYKSSWGVWNNVHDEVRDHQYCITSLISNDQFFDLYFKLTGTTLSTKEILSRTNVYINNIRIRSDRWSLDTTTYPGSPVIRVNPNYLDIGDRVRAQISKYVPSTADLNYNPSISDPNPLILSQWIYDYPCVIEDQRNFLGGLSTKKYFYWVKNKSIPGTEKTVSIKQAALLLKNHDGIYGIPQIFKYFNQMDARPNRYGLLSIKNLSRYVKIQDTYKLRLTRNPTMRDDDYNLSLKNVHIEWQLLRKYQPSRIPHILWGLLTDTLAGETALGEVLPFEPLSSYDDRNDTTERFGFIEQQQILTDSSIAKATLKYTVLNTQVDKYVSGRYVIDYISYPGFDINNLDVYLSTPTNIRKFMSDMWRYAKPKQLNEIFFSILEDAAAANLELSDFFKTSFIALTDVRTIDTAGTVL